MDSRFDPKLDAEAAESFTFDGTLYPVGASFPHKALGVIPIDLEGLWRTGRIRFVEPAPSAPAPPPALGPDPDAMTEAELEAATAPPPALAAKRRDDRDRRARR